MVASRPDGVETGPASAPLLLALVLVAAALFFGGGAAERLAAVARRRGRRRGGALVASAGSGGVARRRRRSRPRPLVRAVDRLVGAPDRSWDYANRTLVYPRSPCSASSSRAGRGELALGLAALLGAVGGWSLAGKVVPWLYDDYGRVARLRAPVGIWNQLALLGDFALPLALWLAWSRRVAGALLAYGWLVAIVLTYSRGGVLVAVVVVVAWLALSRQWIEAAATLVAAGVPAAAVVAVALLLPGVTDDGQSHATRGATGRSSARSSSAALRRRPARAGPAAGADAGAAAASRSPPPAPSRPSRPSPPSVRRARALAGLHEPDRDAAPELVGAVHRAGSNHRWVWWQQAWHGWQERPVDGTGAGSFALTNLRYRTTFLDEATEPHNLPLQFLSETGLVGLGAARAPRSARSSRPVGAGAATSSRSRCSLPALRAARAARRSTGTSSPSPRLRSWRRARSRGGRAPAPGRPSLFVALAAGGVALAVVSSLCCRGSATAGRGRPRTRRSRAARAKAVTLAGGRAPSTPFSSTPLFAQALAEETRGEPARGGALRAGDGGAAAEPAAVAAGSGGSSSTPGARAARCRTSSAT